MSNNRKRKELKRERRKQRLARYRAEHPSYPPVFDFAPGGSSLPKISERLMGVAGSVLDEAATLDDRRFVFELASIAWNACLLSSIERQDCVEQELREAMPADLEGRAMLRGYLAQMMARKLSMFPGDRRVIEGFDLSENGSGEYLQVASSIGGGPDPGLEAPARTA
jgi:hypothetical protein